MPSIARNGISTVGDHGGEGKFPYTETFIQVCHACSRNKDGIEVLSARLFQQRRERNKDKRNDDRREYGHHGQCLEIPFVNIVIPLSLRAPVQEEVALRVVDENWRVVGIRHDSDSSAWTFEPFFRLAQS